MEDKLSVWVLDTPGLIDARVDEPKLLAGCCAAFIDAAAVPPGQFTSCSGAPVTARFLRVYKIRSLNTADPFSNLQEVEAWGPPPTGAPTAGTPGATVNHVSTPSTLVTASSVYLDDMANFGPERLRDGRASGIWHSNWGDFTPWVRFEFAGDRVVSEVVVVLRSDVTMRRDYGDVVELLDARLNTVWRAEIASSAVVVSGGLYMWRAGVSAQVLGSCSPSATPVPSTSPSFSATPTQTVSISRTVSPWVTGTPLPTRTPAPTPCATPSRAATPSYTRTPVVTPTASRTPPLTRTRTASGSVSPRRASPTPTASRTRTRTRKAK